MNEKSWGARHPWAIALGAIAVFSVFSQEATRYRYLFGESYSYITVSLVFILVPTLIFLCLPPKQSSIGRRVLITLFGTAFLPSLALAFLSPMAFDGGSSLAITAAVLAVFALPITIIVAIAKSKHSLWWFTLPIGPLFIAIFAETLF